MSRSGLALVGDIGGTNARFALWENDQLRAVSVLATADFACPEDAIKLYLQGLDLPLGAIGAAASLEALEASIQHNGFEHLVKVRRHSTGSRLQRQRKMHTT